MEGRVTRRERMRAATLQEIKDVARSLMGQCGTTELSLSAVAREMQMSPPALYRYYGGRDELLTALIADGFRDLAERLEGARESRPASDVGARLLAVAMAFRQWAIDNPQQFTLLYGEPVPGYAAPEEGPTTQEARRNMAVLFALVADAAAAGTLSPPLNPAVSPALEAHLAPFAALHPDAPVDVVAAVLQGVCLLEGFVFLDSFGHMKMVAGDTLPMYLRNVELFACMVGLPAPEAGWPVDAVTTQATLTG